MSSLSQIANRTRSHGKQSVSNHKKMEQIGQMDPENCLKCFVSAAKQYSIKKNENTLRSLQKQLDNVHYLKFTLDSFDPRSLLISDSMIHLIELLNDEDQYTNNWNYKEKIIDFFDNLSQNQPLLLRIVQDIFNLALGLETFLSARIEDHANEIFHKNSILLIPCLKLLSNLCHHSKRILRRVQTLENYTSFCKNLMSMVKKNSILAVSALSLFTTLVNQDPLGEKLMSPTIIQETIEILFNIFAKESSNEKTFSAAVHLFLTLLENPKVVNRLGKYWRLIPFLASYLSSASKEKVQLAFKIIQKGIVSNCISFERLSEVLASNCSRLKQSQLTDPPESKIRTDKVVCPLTPQKNNQNRQKVDDLIEKMETGLKINDVKSSEIMQMYEYKIESFSMKEKHLHELLDAKSTALQQLERILSQYRCRWAQSDAEALNLRRLLQEAEKRSEAAKQQTVIAMLQQQDLQREHDKTLDELRKNMEEIVDERNELLDRSEKAEEIIRELNKEMERKDQINKLLQQHIDEYKQAETMLTNKQIDLEKVKKQLSNQLKEKEAEFNEILKKMEKLTEKLTDQSEQIKEQEKQITKYKNSIESLELDKSSLQEEIVVLENTNADLDRQLKDNDTKLKEKIEELNRQKSITTLIQNITSGRSANFESQVLHISLQLNMGTFAGHVVPGSCFIIISIWWTFSIYRKHYKCICNNRKFFSSTWFSLNENSNFPTESLVKLCLVVLGISGETYTAFDRNGVFLHLENGQHISMFLFFGLQSIVEILQFYRFSFILANSEYLTAILGFIVEGLVFSFHLHGRSNLDLLVHRLLVVAIAGCCFTTTLETFVRDRPIVPLARSFCTLLQGTWFYHIGFILYPPLPHMKVWAEADHSEMMLVVMYFTWHAAADLGITLLIGTLVSFKYRKLGFKRLNYSGKLSLSRKEKSEFLSLTSNDSENDEI
uniref:CIP2A N-terminal domain-containing protein n=1 Tax=Strigamia maritima TaxID=126957 RepID=T1JB63_STRMM